MPSQRGEELKRGQRYRWQYWLGLVLRKSVCGGAATVRRPLLVRSLSPCDALELTGCSSHEASSGQWATRGVKTCSAVPP